MGDIADYYMSIMWEEQAKIDFNYHEPEDDAKQLKTQIYENGLHKDKYGKIWSISGDNNNYPKMTDQHLLNTINYFKDTDWISYFIIEAQNRKII